MVLRMKLKIGNLQNARVEFVKILYQLWVLSNKYIYATLGLIIGSFNFFVTTFIYLFIYFYNFYNFLGR